jgi:hypothetical protein
MDSHGARRAENQKEKATMATQTQTSTGSEQELVVEQQIRKVRELYADAPQLGRDALENGLSDLAQELAAATARQSAGRIGARQGMVSELTLITPFVAGGAKRLRGLLHLLEGNFRAADKVGTLHDMRFVFLDNDTRLLFATAYDGDWDTYIDDFVTKIPTELDMFFCNVEGYPGIHHPTIKDFIVKHQVAAEGWYVGNPDLTVAETRRLKRNGQALEELLDKISE